MALLDDATAQHTLMQAEELLWEKIEGRDMDENPRLWLAFTALRSVRIYGKSSNGIPGLRGLGITESVELAQSIIYSPPSSDRDLTIHSYGKIAAAMSIAQKN